MTTTGQAASEQIALEQGHRPEVSTRLGTAALTLGALGVVFGDIGTSPLYAVQAVFAEKAYPVMHTKPQVYGVISLMFWSITMIVSVKYLTFIMRADDNGQGGIMALTSLLHGSKRKRTASLALLVTLGIVGASLFYGDGAITPAISVLSAVEGLKVAIPSLGSLVVPLTIVVLTALFAIQRFGTAAVGNLFGPVMVVWFTVIGVIGFIEITHHPDILTALSPAYGVEFFLNHGMIAFIALGAIVLAVTGAEALYADMGHFGRSPIRLAWFFLVFPSLTLNYLGQGSLILRDAKAVANPFFLLFPGWAQLPMVLLATFATIIASQAVISGAFSVSQQAVQLGYLPRLSIRHTSAKEIGQIYVPAVNMGLFVCVVLIVLAFGSAEGLASAYGVAVTGTFILNSTLFLAVARMLWHKPKKLIALGAGVFLTVEVAFFASNLTKVVHGGWLPLVIALTVFTVLMTWHAGRVIVTNNRSKTEGSLRDFIEQLGGDIPVLNAPGVGVFLADNLDTAPLALRANVEHNHVLHDHVVLVAIQIERVPHVLHYDRVEAEQRILFSSATGEPLGPIADSITRLTLRFGFLDTPDVPEAVRLARTQHLIPGDPDVSRATYFLSQISVAPTRDPDLARWRKKLFVTMSRNAANPAEYFRLPDSRTITTSGRIPL